MALPQNVLYETASPESVTFLAPDDQAIYAKVKYELGGIALSDASVGINVHTWVSRYDEGTGQIFLRNTVTDVETAIITVADVANLSFSFDGNMRPVITYALDNGDCFYYYYDTLIEGYTTTQLPAGSTSPLVSHDDKRRIGQQANHSDVLIFYLLDNKVYMRVQRERYVTSHQIATVSAGSRLIHVGMCTDLRLRIEMENGQFISSP